MKSPFDKIEIKDNQVFISVWRDLPPEPKAEKIECLGYQWLLSGRGQKVGQGAAAVFKEFPDLEAVHLDFVKVDYQLISKKGEPGKYERKGIPTAYLSMTAEKSKLPKESFSKEALQVQENCLKVGRNYISKKEIKL
ncbi:MAG: hypothetical protein J0L93_01630 [Deltaproteobacteria bacterium]|nr:hypothetical protein [Deltaproteobacteria bacterium]